MDIKLMGDFTRCILKNGQSFYIGVEVYEAKVLELG